MKYFTYLFSLLLVLMCSNNLCAAVDPESFSGISNNMGAFVLSLSHVMNNILNDAELVGAVDMIWKAFSIILIIQIMAKYALEGVSMSEILFVVLMISFTRIMLDHYNSLTSMMWGWSEGFAQGIQRAALGTTDIFFVPGFINDLWRRMSVDEIGVFDGLLKIFSVMVFSIFGLLISLLSLFAATWALWGYSVAKLIGWIFIPFIMFDRLVFVFDGWVRFFLGFLVYGIVARVNLVMVALTMKTALGLPTYTVPVDWSMPISIGFFSDIFGTLVFMFIGIIALVTTGKFAASIAGGVGGFGEGIRGILLGASRMAR